MNLHDPLSKISECDERAMMLDSQVHKASSAVFYKGVCTYMCPLNIYIYMHVHGVVQHLLFLPPRQFKKNSKPTWKAHQATDRLGNLESCSSRPSLM